MTPNIATSMMKIAQAVPQLGKADRNAFAKYNYVSIDKYYEGIAKLAAANGIMWQPREISTVVEREIGKDGALRITYAFDLYHESGDSIEEFSKFTILHPIQGAQTAGSALSYADKLFMRSAFKVVTGEQDADASDPDDLRIKDKVKAEQPAVKKVMEAFPDATITDVRPKVSGAVAPDPSPETAITASVDDDGLPTLRSDTTDFITAATMLSRVAHTAEGTDVLRRLWQANIGVIERMEKEAPKLHDKVKKAFNDRRTALKKG
jgi:hypothetical protein